MSWNERYRDEVAIGRLSRFIQRYDGAPVKLMEVCGTHTMAISRYGLRGLLPPAVKLISGPGCPVCVTSSFFVNAALTIARQSKTIVATFGDMMRIPGKDASLMEAKSVGADIRIVYSPLDALKIAEDNPGKQVVFLSVGFETTTPVTALAVFKAKERDLKNFTVLTANKTMPKALETLASDPMLGIDGYIYPGHVSAVIGTAFYQRLAVDLGISGAVAGFEPLDIMSAVAVLLLQKQKGQTGVKNLYRRVVREEGNTTALAMMNHVFQACDAHWRGIGEIPGSGLSLKEAYERYDAWKVFDLKDTGGEEPKGCRCGEILKGRLQPEECALFGKSCTPERPIGACMVSSEGACAAYYRYGGIQ